MAASTSTMPRRRRVGGSASPRAPKTRRDWSQEAIVAALRAYASEHGIPTYDAFRRPPAGCPSRKVIERHFGTWNAALSAAGLPTTRRTRWTTDSATHALRAFAAVHARPPKTSELRAGIPSAETLTRLFGSVSNAFALVDFPEVDRASTPEEAAARGRSTAIAALQSTARALGRSPTEREYHALRASSPARQIRRDLGPWQQALAAADLPPTPTRVHRRPVGVVPADVVARAQELAKTGPVTVERWDQLTDGPRAATVAAHFGGWIAFLAAGDVGVLQQQRRWPDDEQILQMLRDDSARLGHPVREREWSVRSDRPSSETVRVRFGGWRAARRAAGVPNAASHPRGESDGQRAAARRTWTPPEVAAAIAAIAAFAQRHGRPPTSLDFGAVNELPPISAVYRLFGSCSAARLAAGCEGGRERPTWSAQSIIEQIARFIDDHHRQPAASEFVAANDLPAIQTVQHHLVSMKAAQATAAALCDARRKTT